MRQNLLKAEMSLVQKIVIVTFFRSALISTSVDP